MPTQPDLLYVAWFAVAGPIVDYAVFWPAFGRRSRADPAGARRWLWAWATAPAWALVAIGAALWAAGNRSWASLGLSMPDGWRLWTSVIVLVLLAAYHAAAVATLARSSDDRARLRQQIGTLAAVIPHTRIELCLWAVVSLTAGFCEEFLYRGYFVQVFAPWLGWWGAAVLSLPFFAIGHLYQGWSGVLRTGIAGAVYTLAVAVFDSLWPAIALHALVDFGAGTMAWVALREGAPDAVEHADSLAG